MRLYLHFVEERLREQFCLTGGTLARPNGAGIFGAGCLVPTISWNTTGSPILQLAFFGFSMREGVYPMTSHRLESVNGAAPSRAFSEGRCLVPVDSFGPQRSSDHDAGSAYGSIDDRMLAVAALLRHEDRGLAVTILTVAGDQNERLPAIIHEDDYDVWLDDTTSANAAIALAGRSASDLIARILPEPGSRRRC